MSRQELLKKIEEYNKFHEGKIHNQMTAEQRDDGSIDINGPLRIYWGISRPIQLVHCDDIEPAPVAQWRYSMFAGHKTHDNHETKLSSSLSFRAPPVSPTRTKEVDDLLSPSSSDDVIIRRKKVRKFKTVAYRGDQPTRWKRASINGHIFNYDTSVFTPVLGSCTSVTVDGNMKSLDVIETLLDKFKVQNSADEYILSIVHENDEKIMTDGDKPLIERLNIGPDESVCKIFIKERELQPEAVPVTSQIQMPIVETVEEENLPDEVEQLLVLPEAVLRGILAKFAKDEEHDIILVKARYEAARKRILSRMGEISNQTVSVV